MIEAVKVALADARREYDELVREHAAAMDVEQAKRQAEREQMLRELGKLHDLLTAANSYVTDVFHLSADPEQRARVRKLLRETGAGAVYWNRRYEPAAIARDAAIGQGALLQPGEAL